MIHATLRSFRGIPILRRRAAIALLSFVAAVIVAIAAPFVHAEGQAFEVVCSVEGHKLVAVGEPAGHDGEGGGHGDHAAHCPLCMPVGAPPAAITWDFAPVRVRAHVLQSIPAARLASLVGAPLPARGPPTAS